MPGSRARAVPDVLVHTDATSGNNGEGGAEHRVVIVDKQRQRINLYAYRERWHHLAQWPCSTGRAEGPKSAEGDRKTPEGVFFAVRNVGAQYLTPVYGSRALPLDYPNWLDRRENRGGSAIWLHGTNKPLQPRDSNGCVVLDNGSINELARSIRLHHTPVIIVDRVRLWSTRQSREIAHLILSAADQWHRAMMYGDYFSFSHWYTDGRKPSMAWWQKWCRQRRQYGDTYRSAMQQRDIYRRNQTYVMLFDHVLFNGVRQTMAGRRKLYLTLDRGEVRIIGDTYQPMVVNGADPLLQAWRELWKPVEMPHKLASGLTGAQGG